MSAERMNGRADYADHLMKPVYEILHMVADLFLSIGPLETKGPDRSPMIGIRHNKHSLGSQGIRAAQFK